MTDLDRLLLLEKDRALNQNVGKVYEEEYESLKAKIEGKIEKGDRWDKSVQQAEIRQDLESQVFERGQIIGKLHDEVAKLKEENKELKFHLEKWQTGVWTILAKHEDKK